VPGSGSLVREAEHGGDRVHTERNTEVRSVGS
jgi:hypothetical protein